MSEWPILYDDRMWMGLLAVVTMLTMQTAAAESLRDLENSGTLLRLQGDFARAEVIEEKLISDFAEPAGHVFALNTIVTHLTWDETETTYDEALNYHAEQTLAWCQDSANRQSHSIKANYYCGQANFALAYYHGLKGNYYQAGKRGTACIENLEAVLAEDPNLTDAKMHLGISYFVADNLPPFIKMFSRFLWFIPSGNSEKSLPYLLDVIESGDQYRDVARYIYSVVLIEDPASWQQAEFQLRTLVNLYPENQRFHLRLISVLMLQEEYDATLEVANNYLSRNPETSELDSSLAKIWMVRAHLGLNQRDRAAAVFAEIDPVFEASKEDLPGWSRAWHMLTDGQLHDLANRRSEARETYSGILKLAKSTYVNETILDAARAGLLKPYQLNIQ